MTSRLDRLLVLLDTGSTTSVRHTAAKQLAQLAAKTVTGDVTLEEDAKTIRHDVPRGDPAAWAELMAVVARILPHLHSKSHETRTAASVALAQICALVPLWRPVSGVKPDPSASGAPAPEFPQFSVEELLRKGTLLLASSGKEFVKPANLLANPAEVKRARRAAMSRLGLDFLDGVADDDGMDWEKELAADQDMDVDPGPSPTAVKSEPDAELRAPAPVPVSSSFRKLSIVPSTSASPAPPAEAPAAEDEDMSGMSARERNRLKRKRKGGAAAVIVAAPPPPPASNPKFSAMPSSTSNSKVRLVDKRDGSSPSRSSSPPGPPDAAEVPDKVIIDPTKGGAVSPKAAQQSRALDVEPGEWPWQGLVKVLQVDLYNPAWESRHGAAMAMREVLKSQGESGGMRDDISAEENDIEHERWCNDLVSQILCIFVLDRFGDFVSDQVVAPVRETVSQTLASLLIHMPRRSVQQTHRILLQMIRQDFPLPKPAPQAGAPRRGARAQNGREPAHIWEVRHAGLLGIKYEVAVRPDLVSDLAKKADEDAVPGSEKAILQDVVDATILGLGDRDDDVRAVAASCLLPVAEHVVQQLPEVLPQVLVVLWNCLTDMKDDLSSSVGTVMDLLGALASHDAVIQILADGKQSAPITALAPTLYPFFRHTIVNVRLAVVRTLDAFMAVPSLSKEWVDVPFLSLLFQNLVVEERKDIRDATLAAWKTALRVLGGNMHHTISQQLVLQWYEIMMTPLGQPINTATFYKPATANDIERHDVDKHMLLQDLALVSTESIYQTRVAAAIGCAQLLASWSEDGQSFDDLFRPILMHYINSASMVQQFLSSVIVEEWARQHDAERSNPLIETCPLARDLAGKILAWLQGDPPVAYHEMVMLLSRLHGECYNLLHSFVSDCKLPASAIPSLGKELDPTGTSFTSFTIHTAKAAVGDLFEGLKTRLGRTKKKEVSVLDERRKVVAGSIDRYFETKTEFDVRVSAGFAAAFIALRGTPDKVSPIVKGIMNGVKNEENVDLQTRSATAVASFVGFCALHKLGQPPEKIVKNLCTFICQDTERTPTFLYLRKQHAGILSFEASSQPAAKSKGAAEKTEPEVPTDSPKAKISRRGAGFAFDKLSAYFGGTLLEVVPGMWQSMIGGLLSGCSADSPSEANELIGKQFGQDVIDSLSVLEAVVPTLHLDLWPHVVKLLPQLLIALRSTYAIIRQCAARCFATVCDVVTVDAMRFVIEHVIPLLGDPLSLSNRQGAAELIYHIVQKLDIKALPYVIFMVVPVLGRMSDSDDDVRATSTNTFASLVKMVPLEAGLPDPPGFSDDMLAKREHERQFLTQLLDGKKVEQYVLPVTINAELRKYQQEGVNWLAFLAKYQLHGILCDDMGLGKTLQSICILASKHFERAERYKEAESPDAVHLPSLIVCPPTLTGHWFHEVQKYAENLKPVLYVGNARERAKLARSLKNFDVVITSYEVVRNDIDSLQRMTWHYCILDEGHIIKNAKTKLTKAVKSVHANHRLILSGTPIQNNVLELWSLFDFLMPGFLGTEQSFSERFSKPILSNRDGKSKNPEAAALALEALHKQVLPFLLRRLKEDVLNDLPPKIIQDYYCELSDVQKQLYDKFGNSQAGQTVEAEVQSTKADNGQKHVFQSLQYLRKLCNHPALVLKDDKAATAKAFSDAGISGKPNLSDIEHAPKLLALRQLLQDCGIGLGASPDSKTRSSDDATDAISSSTSGAFSQHRALIFCQMKQMLDIIERDLFKSVMPAVTYMRLDGDTDANKRHAVVQTFNADPSIDVLLLTTHVGGLGLTLTGADTVIFVEHDWNPMKDMQAMDRAHRIGQKKVVNVYRLITKGTLEEKIMGLQRFKLNIANSVVTQQNSGLASMDTDLVLDLFRRTTEDEDKAAAAKKKAKEASGPVSQKNVLQGLEDLPPEEEYEGLELSAFMSSLGR